MKHWFHPFFCLCLCFSYGFSQKTDSIDQRVNSAVDQKARADSLCNIAWEILYQDLGRAYEFLLESEKISTEENYKFGIANAQNRLGSIYYLTGTPDTALIYYRSSLRVFQEIGNQERIGSLYLNIGNVYAFLKETDSNFYYTNKSLGIYEEIGNLEGLALAIGNLGNYYQELGVYEKSLKYYYQALKIEDSLGDQSSLASTYNNIAIATWSLENYDAAKKYLNRAIEIWKSQKNIYSMATGYLNMGGLYQDAEDYDSAKVFTIKALNYATSTGDINIISKSYANLGVQYEGIGKYDSSRMYNELALKTYVEQEDRASELSVLINLTSLYMKLGDRNTAVRYADRGISIALEIGDYERLAKLYQNKSLIFKEIGNYREAYRLGELYMNGMDTIQSNQMLQALHEAQVRYETEEKDMRIKNLNQENELKSAQVEKKQLEIEQGKTLRNFLIALAALLVAAAIGFYRSFRIKKKANLEIREKNEELHTQNEEILAQRDQLEAQNLVIGEKNRQITDSLNYAERIQQAMLPSAERLNSLFPENFVFYRPRDIVSGDFFWVGEVEEWNILVVGDCTGHGVPGAFMSMIGMELLNRIVSNEGESDPGQILEKLHQGVNKALKQDTSEVRDGMDMVICSVSKKGEDVWFSGAKNSLLYIVENKLETIKGDKFPIGGHHEEGNRKFTTHRITKNGPISLYLFTDGIQDQFGGPAGKKFMVKNLKSLIHENSGRGMNDQRDNVVLSIEKWMEGQDQLDDMCLLAVRLSY